VSGEFPNRTTNGCGLVRTRQSPPPALFADESHCETCPQRFIVDLDRQFAEQNRANEKDHFDHGSEPETALISGRDDSHHRNENGRAKQDADR
jgi:hypothetical protein